MLVLTRSGKRGDAAVHIWHAGEQIEVHAWAAGGGRVKVGFVGPRSFVVARGEQVAERLVPLVPDEPGTKSFVVARGEVAQPAGAEATEGDKP